MLRAEACPAPGAPGLSLDLQVHRRRLLEEPATRRYGDLVNGVGHFPRYVDDVLSADLAPGGEEPLLLDFGALPDGRPLRLEVRARLAPR